MQLTGACISQPDAFPLLSMKFVTMSLIQPKPKLILTLRSGDLFNVGSLPAGKILQKMEIRLLSDLL
jgi:hypothetical protein